MMSKDATPVAESVEQDNALARRIVGEFRPNGWQAKEEELARLLTRHRLAAYEAGRAEGVRVAEQQRREVQAVWRCAFGDVAGALDILKNKWLTSRRKHEREAGSHLAALADAIWANRDPAPANYNEAAESGKGLHARVKAALSKEPTK